jgi:hypothetical protein
MRSAVESIPKKPEPFGLQRGGRASSLGHAVGELGRIPKTLHLLNFIDEHEREDESSISAFGFSLSRGYS